MTNIWKRSISMFLAVVMVFGMLPVNAFATDVQSETTETTSATEPAAPMAETPVETTEGAPETTEAPTEGTTAPSEEPEETTAPAEETTEPSEEPEETTAPAEETTVPEEEPEETTEPVVVTLTEETEKPTKFSFRVVPDMELPSDEELFRGYAERVFYGTDFAVLGTAAGETLSGDVKLAYNALVPVIKAIAAGERAATTVTLGYDLGELTFSDGTSGTFNAEIDVAFAGTSFSNADLSALVHALLADLPCDMYWFDKTSGMAAMFAVSNGKLNAIFDFTVAANYRDTDAYTADTDKTGAAKNTVAAANDVVDQVAADENVKTDYDILVAYRDWICDNVTYNHDAADSGSFSQDNDPWQLVYVFDGEPSTSVVCEGYSKAFQYLCDLTDFADEDAVCYSVTGNFVCGDTNGGHMWNVVSLDGGHYLVDVTNSDTYSVGDDGSLFMVGGSPNADGSYTFGTCTFTYDTQTESLWANEDILTLAASDYEPPVEEESAVTWTYDESGKTLTISGSGPMDDYDDNDDDGVFNTPWQNVTDDIQYVVVEEGITYIGNYAFANFGNAQSITLPGTLKSIGDHAFQLCSGLTENIIIPDGVTSIGDSAFFGTSITEVIIPDSVTELGEAAFSQTSELKSITFPDGITEIPVSFLCFTGLTSVTIPATVTTVGHLAFHGSLDLKTVFFEGDAPEMGEGVFDYCASNLTLYYPANNATWTDEVIAEIDAGSGTSADSYGNWVAYSEPMTQARLEAELAAAQAAGTYYDLMESLTLEEDMVIDLTNDNGAYPFNICDGVTLTVPSGVTLTLRGGMVIYGTLVLEDGATLAVGDSSKWGNINMNGGQLKIGDEAELTFGENSVIYADTSVENSIIGTVPTGYLYGQYSVRTEEQLRAALAETSYCGNTISGHDLYVQGDITLTQNLTVGVNDYIMAQNGATLTVNSGVTVTNKGGITVYLATLNNNGTIANSGFIGGMGWYTGTGKITGKAHEIEDVVRTTMTQEEFVAALESSGGWYDLRADVVITEDYEMPEGYGIWIEALGSLTIAEGVTFTANGQVTAFASPITIHGTMISNEYMSVEGSGSITVSETGTLVNNACLTMFAGKLVIDGTYSDESTGYVDWDRIHATITGIDKIGQENIDISILAETEEELINGAELLEGYRSQHLYVNGDITLHASLEIPEGLLFTVGCMWSENGAQYQYGLTLAEGATLTNNSHMSVQDHMYLIIHGGATLVNNERLWVYGKLESYGTIIGNEIEGDGEILIHAPAMSQNDFAAELAEAAEAGEHYELNNSVSLTEDMTIDCYVEIAEGASLTVEDGAHLTVKNYSDGTFAQIAINGEMTVESGATLSIVHGSLVHSYRGHLTVEESAAIYNVDEGVSAEGANGLIWFNRTLGGTVTGVPNDQLGIEFYPETTADLESALATTGYSHVNVFLQQDMDLDRDITIPAGASVAVSDGSVLRVPEGFTLTNNGDIDVEQNTRLEILKGATIVNNKTINVDPYAQFVVRGTLTNNGTINGDIVWGEISHEDLMAIMEDCEANGYSWVHESETTLDPNVNGGVLSVSMGSGDPSPEFYLDDGGIIRVPSGTRLEVYNPLVLIGGQVIVEEGGTLYVGGLLAIQEGTVYIEEGGTLEVNENAMGVKGKITWEGDTDTYLSGRWLENWGEGWFENTDVIDENAGRGSTTMDSSYKIFYLNIWDSENLCWNTNPVVPIASSSGAYTITKLQNTDETIKADEANAEYFVRVDVGGTLDHRNDYIYVNYNGQSYTFEFALWSKDLAFYTTPVDSVDTIIMNRSFTLDANAEENAIYLIQRDERILSDVTWTIESWGEDYNKLVSDGEFLTFEEITEGKVWKITVDPEFVDYVQYDYKNFELRFDATVTDTEGNEENASDGIWINPPELLNPKAVFYINGRDYLLYETGEVFVNYPTEEFDEWGNQIWERERSQLPEGVSYDWTNNTMTLENAALELLSVGYDGSWWDDEGNYVEEYRMPAADFTLKLIGSNTIICDNDCALAIWGGANVNITGTGSLHMKATNSPDNVNEHGDRYAYSTVHMSDGATLNIAQSAYVTAQIDGSGFHGDEPAQMHAICGDCNETVTVSGNATLTIKTPEGMRTLDESQEDYAGARGILQVNIVVNDNAKLNADSIYLWDGLDFTQNGGTVTLNPLGEVFWNENLGGYMLSHLGVYLEEADSVFTMNDGTMNINVNTVEEGYVLNVFHGVNVACGDVYINGGELNINGAQDGTAIALQCAWNEDGPVEGLPTGNLYMNGGTINIKGTDGWMYQGIYASPLSEVELNGGTINADYSDSYLEGNVTWDGTVYNGTVAAIRTYGPGEFTMQSGEINLTGAKYEFDGETIPGNAAFEANGSGKITGGKINITNGVFRNNMNIGIEGGEIHVTNDWADLPAIENNLYLPIAGGTVDVTANGTVIKNSGTIHQMGGDVTVTNTGDDNDNSDVPSIHSTGSLLINDGTMDVNGGYYGIIQNYDFEAAAEGNESVLFVGAMEEGQEPTLNISGSKMGIYASAPVDFQQNAHVNIDVEGTPASSGRDWPTALFIDNFDVDVASLTIGGSSVVNLTSADTAGVDSTSKGIVAWLAPVTIQDAAVTIDSEMALYSRTTSSKVSNLEIDVPIRSLITGAELKITGSKVETGVYLHTALESDGSYAGKVSIAEIEKITTLDALKAHMTMHDGRWALEETVVIEGSFALEDIIIDVVNGGYLIIAEDVTLTIPEGSHLIAQENGTISVGGKIVNSGIMAADNGGRITFANADGYVRGVEWAVLNVHYRNSVLSSVEGISREYQTLYADVDTMDQIHFVLLAIENLDDYGRVQISVNTDLTLTTMTVPENTELFVNNVTVTMTENITNYGNITPNYGKILVNGTLDNKGGIFINNASIMEVNGTLNNYQWFHVGYWKDPGVDEIAGTLNINDGGVLNNYEYLNICPDFYIEAENRYCGGDVNVQAGGLLNNTFDRDANKYGFVDLGGTLNVYGTMTNSQSVTVCGTLNLYGKLVNDGSIRLQDLIGPELITYEGAELINNTMVANLSTNGIISLAEGTYTQGSYTANGSTEYGELSARYFDDQTMAQIDGAPEGTVSILYEGSNAEALLAASECYNWNADAYDRCFLRVESDMTFPAGKELNLSEGTYLVVLNNGDNYQGSLTVEGAIFNQSYIRLFGADMTIPAGGWITNKGIVETGMMLNEKPTVTVGGLLENASTGIVDMTNAEFILTEGGIMQNNLAGGNLGTVKGIPVSEQTLFSEITEGTQEQFMELIGKVKNDGYHGGYFWISEDLHITSSMVIPGGIGISVQDGVTLTVDPDVICQVDGSINVDAGGNLVIDGTLGVGGTVDVRGTMTVNGSVGSGPEAVITVFEPGELDIYGWFGVDSGTLNVLGTLNNNGTISVTWTEERHGNVTGDIDRSQVVTWMPFNHIFPNHNEEDIAAMLAFAEENGYGSSTAQFTIDYTFTKDFVAPENLTFSIGAYKDEEDFTATTVTIPSGVTLTVNGNLEVAKGSKLVIEEGGKLIFNGENMEVYGTLENNGFLLLDRGYVDLESATYVHGKNAVVHTEKYDDYEPLHVYGIREYETLVFRGNDESLLLAMLDEASNDGYSLGAAYITEDMTMNSAHWYVEPSNWSENSTFDVDVYVDGCTLTIPVDTSKDRGINTSLYVQNGGHVQIDGCLYVHADMLIMDGGTVTVDGSISTGTVYVYTGGLLTVNGKWYGYNPINMGGTIIGDVFDVTQEDLENLLAEHDYVVLRSSLTLTDDLVIEEGKNLHVANEGYVLTVPAGKTLTVNGTLLIGQGAKLDIQGTLIVNGTVRVVGADMVNTGTVENNGTVVIADEATLLDKGAWNGNAAVLDGGTLAMTQEILEAKLENSSLTNPYSLTTQVTLEKNMILTGYLYIEEGGKLIVPEGITLTNNGSINVLSAYNNPDNGGRLNVYGALVNNGTIFANDDWTDEACVTVAKYTHGSKGTVNVNFNDDRYAKVEGIPAVYLSLMGVVHTAENANAAMNLLETEGYLEAVVQVYGKWDYETQSYLPGSLDGDIHVPENATLAVGYGQYITLNGNITADGLLGVSDTATLEVAADSKITLNSTGAIELQGNGRIIGDGMIDAQLNQINLPTQVECRIGYYATASTMAELLNAITAGLPEIHVIADFTLTKGMTVPSDVTILIEQGVTLTVSTTGSIVNNGAIIVDGKLIWVKGAFSGNRIILGETGEVENLPEGGYYTPGTVVESFNFTTDADYGIDVHSFRYDDALIVPVQETIELYVKDILPADAEDFRYVAEITEQVAYGDGWEEVDCASLVLDETTGTYKLSTNDFAAVTVTATAVDANGDPITDENGNFITDTIQVEFVKTLVWMQGGRVHGGGKLTLDAVGYVQQRATVEPQEYDISDREIVWYMDPGDETYATLAGKGTTATLTAKAVTEQQTVTAYAETADGIFVPWQKTAGEVTIYPKTTKLTLNVDGTDVTGKTIKHNLNTGALKLDLDVTPAQADSGYGFTTWSSSDDSIATVDETGLVTFTGEQANVKITARVNDGSGKLATVTITPVKMATFLYSYGENLKNLTGGQSATYYVCSDLTDADDNTTYMNPSVIEWYLSDADGSAIAAHPYASITAAGKLTTKAVETTSTVYLMARLKDDTAIVMDTPLEVTIHPTITKLEIQDRNGDILTTDTFDYELMAAAGENAYTNFQLCTYPYDGVLKEIQWKSSNVKIAGFLDENGDLQATTTQKISGARPAASEVVELVTAGNNVAGTVTITATAVTHNNVKKTATFKITYGVFVKDIELTDVDGATIFDEEPIIVRSGSTYTFKAKAVANDPDNWTPNNTTVTWAVDNTTAASISSGKLTTKTVYNPEFVTVTVASKDGACTVTRDVVVLPAVKNGAEALILKLGEENVTKVTKSFDGGSFQLTAFTVDEAAEGYLVEETDITWESGKTTVATVDENGLVTVNGNGTAVITATATDGRTAQMTVKGTRVSERVEITADSDVVASGKTLKLTATVEYTSGDPDAAVVWSVDDTTAAKVSTSGLVTATKNLMETTTVTVTAAPKDGVAEPATFDVTIVPLATGVQIFSAAEVCAPVDGSVMYEGEVLNNVTLTWDMEAAKNGSMLLRADVLALESIQSVTWKSSSTAIATFYDSQTTVSENGDPVWLDFHKAGTVTITATANDGSGKKATFKIVVVKQMTDLYFDNSLTGYQDYVLGGKGLAMSKMVTYEPTDVTNKKLAWEIVGGSDYATINASTGALTTKAVTVPYDITVRVSSTDGSLYEDDQYEFDEPLYDELELTIYPATTKVSIYNDGENVTGTTIPAFVEDTLWLEARSTPEESMMYSGDADWQWTSSAPDYVSVDEEGMVEVLKGGKTVTITAKALDGTNKTATFKIKTLQPVEDITFQDNLVVAGGKQLKLATLFTFEQEVKPTITKLTWEILEGGEYATINASTGVLTAGKVSIQKTVLVRATATDGSETYGECYLDIWPATTKLQIMDGNMTDWTGKTYKVYLDTTDPDATMEIDFSALATPGTAMQEADGNVLWSVPASTTAYVDVDPETGVVTAKKTGKTVTVTAKARDGSGKSATVKIQVLAQS